MESQLWLSFYNFPTCSTACTHSPGPAGASTRLLLHFSPLSRCPHALPAPLSPSFPSTKWLPPPSRVSAPTSDASSPFAGLPRTSQRTLQSVPSRTPRSSAAQRATSRGTRSASRSRTSSQAWTVTSPKVRRALALSLRCPVRPELISPFCAVSHPSFRSQLSS